jgi:hypothetical protein
MSNTESKTVREAETRAAAGLRQMQVAAGRDLGQTLAEIRRTCSHDVYVAACERVRDFAARNFPAPNP